ncbi:MAG: 4-hydroxy-tetrahydrodipicolinate reductase [Opitutaceae bacterium]
MNIAINGSNGRMGRAIAAAAEAEGINVTGLCDLGGDLKLEAKEADVIVDFSFHESTASVIETAVELKKALVIGTTGHTDVRRAELKQTASAIPTVWAGNYSIGVNLLFHLTQVAASVLDEGYDAEVLEMHHRMKKDAPSGTAVRLCEIILEERGLGPEALRHGRSGVPGERSSKEVGVHALRGGDVVGDHTVYFAGLGERIELTHRATDRQVFATGALRAARWALRQAPGVYDMQDVLGFRK